MKTAEWSVTYTVMFGLLTVTYLQFVIMLAELENGLGVKKTICVARLPQCY
jgi:hypothetical protein